MSFRDFRAGRFAAHSTIERLQAGILRRRTRISDRAGVPWLEPDEVVKVTCLRGKNDAGTLVRRPPAGAFRTPPCPSARQPLLEASG